MRKAVRTTLALALLSYLLLIGSYFFACAQDQCMAGLPKGAARVRVEECVHLATHSACTWSAAHAASQRQAVTANGGRCVAYNVMGIDPIEVLYDRDGGLVHVFSAYE